MGQLIDLTGQRFGRLTVVERAGSDNRKRATWLCRCDCGTNCIKLGTNLANGITKSCGCLRAEHAHRLKLSHNKHGTRLYAVWKGMNERCYTISHVRYHRYGGRGITVCDEWRHNFQAFYDWAVANGYDENALHGECTLDRIDNDKGYSPDNCRWADAITQARNKSTTIRRKRKEKEK